MFHQVVILMALLNTVFSTGLLDKKSRCEIIKTPACKFLGKHGYNVTSFPNMHDHRSQEEAASEISVFAPLIKIGCSEALPFFLCSSYLPYCTEKSDRLIKPCRSLCEKSKAGCQGIMTRFGFTWPSYLECNKFPDEKKGEICFGADIGELNATTMKPVVTKPKKIKVVKGLQKKGKMNGVEGNTIKIKCKHGEFIEIRKVNHRNSGCCGEASKHVLSAICHKKSTCTFKVAQETFGGHCQNMIGSVTVKYRCVQQLRQKTRC